MIFVSKGIDEVGVINNCFISYIFVFLIALFKDLSLFLGISNRASILKLNITDAICGNNCYD